MTRANPQYTPAAATAAPVMIVTGAVAHPNVMAVVYVAARAPDADEDRPVGEQS
jgi:hypothetical protein